jgi:hypothetical protein
MGKMPENPAPVLWALYHQMEKWHHLPEPGGLLDQYYILMAELEVLDDILSQRRTAAAAMEEAQKEMQRRQN